MIAEILSDFWIGGGMLRKMTMMIEAADEPSTACAPPGDDWGQLRRWVDEGSEAAFREVVERYAGLVFGVALRKTGERPLAEEAVQNVFADLARKAPLLVESRRPLAAWLHRCAVYESVSLRRGEIRHREKVRRFSYTPSDSGGAPPDPWKKLRPLLDQAIDSLPEADRRVLLLHWFERLPFAEIAARTGSTAGAAQRRGSRAVARLGVLLRRRGVPGISVMTLAAGLTPQLAQAAPAGLAAAVSAAALETAPAAAGGLGFLLTRSLQTMASAKTITAAAVLFAAALPVGLQWAQSAWHATDVPLRTAISAGGDSPAAVTSRRAPPGSGAANPGFDFQLIRSALDGLLADPENYELQLEFRRFLFSLELTEIPAVRDLLLTVSGKKREILYEASHALFARWAELDPTAAMEAAKAVPRAAFGYYPLRGAFVTWAFADLDSAWAWLEKTGADGSFGREFLGGEALAGIVSEPGIVADNPKFDDVMSRLQAMDDHAWRDTLRYWVLRAAPRRGLEWAKGLTDEPERARWLPQALELLGAADPERALNQLHLVENTARREEAGHNILWPWLLERDATGHRSPPDLVDRLSERISTAGIPTLFDPDMVDRLPEQAGVWPVPLFRDTGDALTRQDAPTALAALQRLPEGPERAEFIQGMLRGAPYSDASAILPALAMLPEMELIRQGGLTSFTQTLTRQNPKAAAEWLTSLAADSPVREWAAPHFREITGRSPEEYSSHPPK